MKRSVPAEALDNAQNDVQEVPKKARHDCDNMPTLAPLNVDEHLESPPIENNGDNNAEIDAVSFQNGHHDNGVNPDGQQNGFNGHNSSYTSNGSADHEQVSADHIITEQCAMIFDVNQIPEQFMADDSSSVPEENKAPAKQLPEQVNIDENLHTEDAAPLPQEPITKEPAISSSPKEERVSPDEHVDMGAGSSRSEGWDQQELSVWTLKGHNDDVTSLALDGNLLVTASADTTLRVWDLASHTEVCSLRGHSAKVTSVVLLSILDSRELLVKLGEEETAGRVAVSGSSDCCVKIWLVPEGRLLRSNYTFNGINHVGYLHEGSLVLTATDAGKIEIFDAVDGKPLSSLKPFDHPIVSFKVSENMVICGDTHGKLQSYKVKCYGRLMCIRSTNVVETARNSLAAIDFSGMSVVTGHLSGSLKTISWATCVVKRLRQGCIGRVNDVNVNGELLLASTSDKDTSALHFYELPQGKYLGSVQGEGRMLAVASTRHGRGWRFVTGGTNLRVWESVQSTTEIESADAVTARVTLWPQPEEAESDSEDETEEEDQVEVPAPVGRKSCNIL